MTMGYHKEQCVCLSLIALDCARLRPYFKEQCVLGSLSLIAANCGRLRPIANLSASLARPNLDASDALQVRFGSLPFHRPSTARLELRSGRQRGDAHRREPRARLPTCDCPT